METSSKLFVKKKKKKALSEAKASYVQLSFDIIR